ncbi:MAG: amino acid deaminase [Burkholderiaceae bacterium]|nr:MAG: amino acid deaminase [Burkholderiaceae bacterium]
MLVIKEVRIDVMDPVLDAHDKGYPHNAPPRACSMVGAAGWNVLAGDLPLPLALIKQGALEHNIAWMQDFVRAHGIDLAPHGKTTMSPQLFARQLAAGAWGMTFATVTQLAVGVAAGVHRALIANQVLQADDLAGIAELCARHADLRVIFLVDSLAQLALIETWSRTHPGAPAFEVMMEIGVAGARTGCRTEAQALALARAMRASAAVTLVGIECYEGQGVTGDDRHDADYVAALLDRVQAIAQTCLTEGLFEAHELLFSAGGSALFDLVAKRLRPTLNRPVRGLLRSGCYVTHDHGHYAELMRAVNRRIGCATEAGLRPAIEVWAAVQSCPEPHLALLTAGRRDISYDQDMPIPIARAALGERAARPVPRSWRVSELNDQHAYLRWDAADDALAPVVGERVGLGISHPCTTFDKWRWMPIVDNDYRVVDAITMHF